MINKINNIFLPSFKGINNDMRRESSYKDSGCVCDCFCKSSSNGDIKKMDSELFSPSCIDFDKEKSLKILIKRIRTMPMMMDTVFAGVSAYLSGNISRPDFVKGFLDESVPLYKRISLGKDSEDYSKNYAPEILMLRKISSACTNYNDENPDGEVLDKSVAHAVKDYTETDIKREKYFTV